ncbi:MAG: NAD(P)-dependent oxidoreductase [Gaiellales bacterium]
MTLSVGVVGLGAMGLPMAERLVAAGLPLVVLRDLADEALATLAAAGARRAGTLAELASEVDVVLLSLPDGEVVEQVVLGPAGIADGGREGLVVLDTSTIEPDRSRALATALARTGIMYVDAPVSGGTLAAAAGTLSVMAGGDEDALERARPVLDAIAERVLRLGPVGAGQVAKACNQLIVLGTIEIVAEALALGGASGIDPAALREALLGGFAASRILELHGARMLRGDYEPGGRARFHLKDIAVVEGLKQASGARTPAFDAAARQLEQLVELGGGDLDHAALRTLLH